MGKETIGFVSGRRGRERRIGGYGKGGKEDRTVVGYGKGTVLNGAQTLGYCRYL